MKVEVIRGWTHRYGAENGGAGFNADIAWFVESFEIHEDDDWSVGSSRTLMDVNSIDSGQSFGRDVVAESSS